MARIARVVVHKFDRLILCARRQAKVVGMKKTDISAAIAKVRLRK